MTWPTGDVSVSEVLTDNDHLYPSHVNSLRQSMAATATVGRTSECQYYCDGTADDVQIQAAVDYVVALGGGIVFIKKGTYNLATYVILGSNVTILGEGSGVATLVSPDAAATGHVGILHIPNKNGVVIDGVGFNVKPDTNAQTGWCAISSYGHTSLVIKNCYFTGTSDATGGIINLDGYSGTASFNNTLVEGNIFDTIPNTYQVALYPRSGHIVTNTRVVNNYFHDCFGPNVYLNEYDFLRNTLVSGNVFVDTVGTLVGSGGGYGCAVGNARASGDKIYNLKISDNLWYNTNTTTRLFFVMIYYTHELDIVDNIVIGTKTGDSGVIALGTSANTDKNVKIIGNYCEGFDSFWDPDSMEFVEVADNIIANCGNGLTLGYGTQNYIKIHHNVVYNSVEPTLWKAGIVFGNAAVPKKVEVSDNLIIDDQNPSIMDYAFLFTGTTTPGTFNFTDVTLKNNRVYVPNGALTSVYYKQDTGVVLPRVIEGNEIEDSTGKNTEFVYAQGNVTGATIFNRAEGEIITATLTGNITVTLTSGTVIGETLELRLTQDGTGSRTVGWPSNFKKAGGTLTLSTGVGAVDHILVRWNGTNWLEVSRNLNVS